MGFVSDVLRTKTFRLLLILLSVLLSVACDSEIQNNESEKVLFVVNYTINQEQISSIYNQQLEGHGYYFDSLYLAKKLVFAGPVSDTSGLVIYKASDQKVVLDLINNDPAVKSDLLRYQVSDWDLIIGKELIYSN